MRAPGPLATVSRTQSIVSTSLLHPGSLGSTSAHLGPCCTRTWDCLVDAAKEERPRSQGIGDLIFLLHTKLAKLGHLLGPSKENRGGLCVGGRQGRQQEGSGDLVGSYLG